MKYFKLIIFSLLLLFIFSFSFNSYYLDGVVLDKETNEKLIGVLIDINGEKIYTDLDGKFYTKVKKGKIKIQTDYISYENYKNDIEIKTDTNVSIKIKSK